MRPLVAVVTACLIVTACGPGGEESPAPDATTVTPSPAAPAAPTPSSGATASPGAQHAPTTPSAPEAAATPGPTRTRPDWLGTRVLPTRPDGFGVVRPTPPELVDRRFPPPPSPLPEPRGTEFRASVTRVPDAVLERSTWRPGCPVSRGELRYIQLTFWGFDDRPHAGELLVHRSVASDLVGVFRRLYRARFPIEEMRVETREELDVPPTGDGNNTTAFVCRPVTGGEGWSQHAYGLAIDINPFHNPYRKGDLVVPELASAYVDRDWRRPGMIHEGDVVVAAFDALGWGWGGRWRTLDDWQHFSTSGN